MTNEQETYNMGFTAGAAMLNEMYAVAGALSDCGGDWEKTKDKTFRENLMEKDKKSSIVRYFSLMKQRLEVLNEDIPNTILSWSLSRGWRLKKNN